jgi:hypothetical protein
LKTSDQYPVQTALEKSSAAEWDIFLEKVQHSSEKFSKKTGPDRVIPENNVP